MLRVRLDGADLAIDAMCGDIWHNVHQNMFLYREPGVLDDSNPAVVSALVAAVKEIVVSGWPTPARCDPGA